MLSRTARGGLSVALVFASLAGGATAACSSGKAKDSREAPATSDDRPGEDSDSVAADDDPDLRAAGVKKDVCATLDYGHTRSNRDYFRTFADDAAAFAYSKDFLAYSEMPEGTEVSHDRRMERILGRVYDGFRAVFPVEMDGLDAPPRIVVINADGVNAFAGYDERPHIDKAPWIFWIHRGTVTTSTPDDQITGLFAHELGHLILRDMLPETRTKIRTHYRVPGNKEHGIIGAVTPDDPVVEKSASELRRVGAKVGRYPIFGALPISAYQDSDYEDLLATLATTRGRSADPSACDTLDSGLRRMRAVVATKTSIHLAALYLSKQERDELTSLVPSTTDAMKRCYGHVKMPLFELWVRDRVRRRADLSEDARNDLIIKSLDPSTSEHALMRANLSTEVEERADDDANRPTVERFASVVETLHRRVQALEGDSALPIEELRVFDLEEDADDAAVRVLRYLDEDPLANARLYLNMMPNAAECTKEIDKGNVPAYGRFIDEHNSTCWRFFHSKELAKALEKCPKVPLRRAATGDGTGGAKTRAAVTSDAPRRPSLRRQRAAALEAPPHGERPRE